MAAPLYSGQGWLVESLSVATGGKVQLDPVYEIAEPSGNAGDRDVLGARYGVDLAFPDDLVTRANWDLLLTTGTEGIRAVFARSLLTQPGEIYWTPDYGIGIRDFLNAPASAANLAQIQNRIRTSLESDQDIEEIEELAVEADGQGVVEITLKVRLAGHTEDLSVRIRGTS